MRYGEWPLSLAPMPANSGPTSLSSARVTILLGAVQHQHPMKYLGCESIMRVAFFQCLVSDQSSRSLAALLLIIAAVREPSCLLRQSSTVVSAPARYS